VSKGVGEHHDEVGARFDVPGRGGAHRVELSVVVRAVGMNRWRGLGLKVAG
jgi:hypothetical protein